MAKMVKIIKKKDEYSMEYEVGDVLKVDSTWYGGVTVLGKTGVPVSIDKDEYEEVKDISEPENAEPKSIEEGLRPAGQGVSTEAFDHLKEIEDEVRGAVKDLLAVAGLEPGDALVVGCSSSEVANMRIGSFSSEEIGKCIAGAILDELKDTGVYMAAQCCEHLNRALIVEEEAAEKYGLEMVNVVPQLKAGGSFATAAYAGFEHPTAVERIQAHAGYRRHFHRYAPAPGCSSGADLDPCDRRRPCDVCENEAEIYWRRAGALSGCEIKKMRSTKKRGNQEK